MNLKELNQKLVDLAIRRVRAGYATERGLAKECGFSQPHMHNVLKGVRSFSTVTADRLMAVLSVGVDDLVWSETGQTGADIRAVALLRQRIGPGHDASLSAVRGAVPFRAVQLEQLVQPVAGKLAADPVMPGAFAANDLVLMDQSPTRRNMPGTGGYWVMAEQGGLRVRQIRMQDSALYVVWRSDVNDPAAWRRVSLNGRSILDVVRARIVWFGREVETETP